MPRKTFSKNELKDKNAVKSYAKSRNIREIGGFKVANVNSPESHTLTVAQNLEKDGYMAGHNSKVSLGQVSTDALGALGCTLLEGTENRTKARSLFNRNKTNVSKNPSISEPLRDASIENQKTTASDKFSDPNDPFYVLDEKRSNSVKEQDTLVKDSENKISTKNATDLVSKFYSLNIINNNTHTLKQFTP